MIVLPAVVIVLPVAVELKFINPVNEYVIPVDSVKLPKIFKVELPANVPVNPVKFRLRQFAVAATVQVTAPDAASKNTSSALVGTDAPPAPPDVVAHLVPAVPSQFADPPTQYLSATVYTL